MDDVQTYDKHQTNRGCNFQNASRKGILIEKMKINHELEIDLILNTILAKHHISKHLLSKHFVGLNTLISKHFMSLNTLMSKHFMSLNTLISKHFS